MNRKFFSCSCQDASHNLAISLESDIDDDVDYAYFHVHLCQHKNFFQRLYAAIKYIFNWETSYWGHYTEIILDKKTTLDLAQFLINNDQPRTE